MKQIVTIVVVVLATLAYIFWAGRGPDDPGVAPTAPFQDGDTVYSADGCWWRDGPYWRPLRRCHIVRVVTKN